MRNGWMTLLAIGLAIGCASPTGDVTVLLEAEETITGGLDPGEGAADVVDGWRVRFSKYLVAVGDVHLERTADGQEAHDPSVHVVDLASLPPGGIVLTRFESLDARRWDSFGDATAHAHADATKGESVSQADFDEMVANDWTYLIEGTLENASGESCPPRGECRAASRLSFRLGASVETFFGPCEDEGLPGVTVTESGTAVTISIHGDHLFFDTFPSGAEVIERRAQWLANADTDGDDAITAEELMAIDAAALFPSEVYNLAGAPFPIESAFDYVRAQLATQGHFQGEGECPWSVDGASGGHDHDHDH